MVGTATFVSYLLVYEGQASTPAQQIQASTSAVITLLVGAVGARRGGAAVRVVAGRTGGFSALAYVVIFSIPLARAEFMLNPSNVAFTTMALVTGSSLRSSAR